MKANESTVCFSNFDLCQSKFKLLAPIEGFWPFYILCVGWYYFDSADKYRNVKVVYMIILFCHKTSTFGRDKAFLCITAPKFRENYKNQIESPISVIEVQGHTEVWTVWMIFSQMSYSYVQLFENAWMPVCISALSNNMSSYSFCTALENGPFSFPYFYNVTTRKTNGSATLIHFQGSLKRPEHSTLKSREM